MQFTTLSLLPKYNLRSRNNKNVIRAFLQDHQLAFYHYCLHDSLLAFFIAIVEALSVLRLAWTQHNHSTEPEYLEWIQEFQRDVVKAFTSPIWSLPVDSNQLLADIAISPKQYWILKELT